MRVRGRLIFLCMVGGAAVLSMSLALSTFRARQVEDRHNLFAANLLLDAWIDAENRADTALAAAAVLALHPDARHEICGSKTQGNTGATESVEHWLQSHPDWRIETRSADGSALFNSVSNLNTPPLAAPGVLAKVLRNASPILYFSALGQGHYGWIWASRVDCMGAWRALLIQQDVSPAFRNIAAVLGGNLSLVNLQGVVVQNVGLKSVMPPSLFADTPLVTTSWFAGTQYQRVSVPVAGMDSRAAANLVWSVPLQVGGAALTPGAGRGQLFAALIGIVLTLSGWWFLRVVLRAVLAPLHRAIDGLDRIARPQHLQQIQHSHQNHLQPHPQPHPQHQPSHQLNHQPATHEPSFQHGHQATMLDIEDAERQDEAGAITRAVDILRNEVLTLEMMRDERVRSAQQQGRLIQENVRQLASGLEEAERLAIEQMLDRLVWQEGSDRHPLADLATVLGRLSSLVGTQHQTLLGLVAELAEALKNESEYAALQQELQIAREMQLSILPSGGVQMPGVDLHASIIPAREVGGDFYDYFVIDKNRIGLVIGDVSGKGMPAAFFMAIARSLLKSTAMVLVEPAQVVARLNDLLCTDNPHLMFVTLFYGVADITTGELIYVNAGHNPPLLVRTADVSKSDMLPTGKNMALGVVEKATFQPCRITLERGDFLFLYTDGVTEAQDANLALFGEAALEVVLTAAIAEHPKNVAAIDVNRAVVEVVEAFQHGVPQADDITCLTFRLTQLEA